jgi:hypothetical protein
MKFMTGRDLSGMPSHTLQDLMGKCHDDLPTMRFAKT